MSVFSFLFGGYTEMQALRAEIRLRDEELARLRSGPRMDCATRLAEMIGTEGEVLGSAMLNVPARVTFTGDVPGSAKGTVAFVRIGRLMIPMEARHPMDENAVLHFTTNLTLETADEVTR